MTTFDTESPTTNAGKAVAADLDPGDVDHNFDQDTVDPDHDGRFPFLHEPDDGDDDGLFPGDTGTLNYPQRHALNVILKNTFLSAASHPQHWQTLIADPTAIRSRLHELFFDLEIDRHREVAIKRPVTNPGGDRFPTLVYDTRLSREETIVMLFLRRHYRTERAGGNDRVFVDIGDIHDYATTLRPPTATDVTGDRNRVSTAIDSIRRSGILTRTREDDRYEVSAAIELVLTMDKLDQVLADLRTKNGHTSADAASGAETTDEGSGEADDLELDDLDELDLNAVEEETA